MKKFTMTKWGQLVLTDPEDESLDRRFERFAVRFPFFVAILILFVVVFVVTLAQG